MREVNHRMLAWIIETYTNEIFESSDFSHESVRNVLRVLRGFPCRGAWCHLMLELATFFNPMSARCWLFGVRTEGHHHHFAEFHPEGPLLNFQNSVRHRQLLSEAPPASFRKVLHRSKILSFPHPLLVVETPQASFRRVLHRSVMPLSHHRFELYLQDRLLFHCGCCFGGLQREEAE